MRGPSRSFTPCPRSSPTVEPRRGVWSPSASSRRRARPGPSGPARRQLRLRARSSFAPLRRTCETPHPPQRSAGSRMPTASCDAPAGRARISARDRTGARRRKGKALEAAAGGARRARCQSRAGRPAAAHRRRTHRQEPTDGARKKARPEMLQTVAHVAEHQERLRQLRSHRCEPWTLQSYRLPSALMKPAERQAAEHAIAARVGTRRESPPIRPRSQLMRCLWHTAV